MHEFHSILTTVFNIISAHLALLQTDLLHPNHTNMNEPPLPPEWAFLKQLNPQQLDDILFGKLCMHGAKHYTHTTGLT